MSDSLSIAEICLAGRMLEGHGPVDSDDIPERVEEISAGDCGVADPVRSMRGLAGLVDGSRLGQEDLWHVLAHSGDLPIAAPLREALDLPPADPDGATLSFREVIVNDGLVAYTVIEPAQTTAEVGPSKPPLVFVTGLHHRTAVYLPTLIEIAKRDHRKVISVDLPGMGGSLLPDNESVYAGNLEAAVRTVIGHEVSQGATFDLMAHSTGTVPARAIYEMGELLGRRVGRVVMVAPLPAEEERTFGRRLAPSFARAAIGEITFTGGLRPRMIDSRFVNRHTPGEQAWLHRRIDQEDYSSSLWAALSVFWGAHTRPILAQVGHDPRLRVVIVPKDNIFTLNHPEDWCGRRGVYCIEGERADHSFLAGPVANPQYIDGLLHALNDNLDSNQPTLNFGEMYRHLEGSFNPGVSFASDGILGVGGTLEVTGGLAVIGRVGIGVALRAGPSVGVDLEDGHRQFSIGADGEVTLKPLDLPVRVGVGAGVVGSRPGGLSEHLEASVRINPEDVVAIGARATYTLHESEGDRHNFLVQTFLEVPFFF